VSDELGRQVIVTQRPGYLLHIDDDESDLLVFESLCRAGEEALRAGQPERAATSLRAALALWRGELLEGLPVDVMDVGGTARLELLRTAVLEQIAEAELAGGRHREFLSELETWVVAHPLDERLRGHLMLALYRCGRQADALARYREGRELLVEELGIDPSRDLRELQKKILDQDRALDWTSAGLRDLGDAESTALRSSVLVTPGFLELADRSFPLERTVTTIGRLPDQDLVLDDVGVSRRHAEIRRHGGSYRLVDTGSANGTVVNGSRVAEYSLVDGDVIRVGDVEMTFRTSS
jgi:DNA-binding SARP family transcriptional activator